MITVLITGCSLDKDLPDGMAAAVDSVRTRWVPDRRTDVFDLTTTYRDGIWELAGETSVPDAKAALERVIDRYLDPDERRIRIDLLPSAELGDSVHAIVNVSVGNIRRAPKHSAEMIDQVVSGMVLKVLKRKSYWYLVQTPTGYVGWLTGGSMVRIDGAALREWQDTPRVMVNENYAQVFGSPGKRGVILSDAVLGSVFQRTGELVGWTGILLADGREGYIETAVLQPMRNVDDHGVPDGRVIVDRAKSLLGIPYLWGGNSSKGFDCSGFTGTVFRLEGRQLPRDANMQAELGQPVEPDSIYSNILPGDLIFFGPPERVTHVGICLGGSYFIHCSDDVHINSLDESDPLFNAYRKRTVRFIKRL